MTRKQLRDSLAPFRKKSFATPLAHLALDTALWLAAFALALLPESIAFNTIGSALMALATSRLFIIGHDACHLSLTPSRNLNRVIGRLCFLPSYTPYSLWEVGHNVAHHGYNNLRGHEYVWEPMSPQQYAAYPRWRRALERFYRGGAGFWLYYMIELWWKRLYFPSRKYAPVRRRVFTRDSLLVSAFAIAHVAFVIWIAVYFDRTLLAALCVGVLLPFVFWHMCVGFVTYCQHTHPGISWYGNKADWTNAKAYISATAHAHFSLPFGALFHWIFEHPAHHVDVSIPFYHLRDAQAALHAQGNEHSQIVQMTWCEYWCATRTFALFDFESGRWLAFPQ